ncbi:hypothetical protein SCALIN_C01_0080 [Candidatus Scalindua japonica]|uniref:Metalloenzyme domain-containing protein n=1 Tax=Candidatus Scalindua japonica TaxID=1284222 RepID=A0A286TTA9_9BACT|nr:phosphoglyceromutase [Candidatus Scalindua japonica]GAX59149.1 hypothetical protein SCALIN_C01_0080 [Candidatus Scalindua japonica]
MSSRVIFVFLDGVGLGRASDNNPFTIAPMPNLYNIIQKPLVNGNFIFKEKLLLKGIDACLGVEGLPQSATGQTSLFTGTNAAKELGYHLVAYPNNTLIKIINEHNLLKNAVELGYKATFANAYHLERYNQLIQSGRISHAVTTLCVKSAQLSYRTLSDLQEGTAVYWDITHEVLRKEVSAISIVQPEIAGENLVRLSGNYDLVLYECFMTDILGHSGKLDDILSFLQVLDRFFSGIVKNMNNDTTLIITSDHGNIEDISVASHTYNPVPLLVIGKEAETFEKIESILEVTGAILSVLSGQ